MFATSSWQMLCLVLGCCWIGVGPYQAGAAPVWSWVALSCTLRVVIIRLDLLLFWLRYWNLIVADFSWRTSDLGLFAFGTGTFVMSWPFRARRSAGSRWFACFLGFGACFWKCRCSSMGSGGSRSFGLWLSSCIRSVPRPLFWSSAIFTQPLSAHQHGYLAHLSPSFRLQTATQQKLWFYQPKFDFHFLYSKLSRTVPASLKPVPSICSRLGN